MWKWLELIHRIHPQAYISMQLGEHDTGFDTKNDSFLRERQVAVSHRTLTRVRLAHCPRPKLGVRASGVARGVVQGLRSGARGRAGPPERRAGVVQAGPVRRPFTPPVRVHHVRGIVRRLGQISITGGIWNITRHRGLEVEFKCVNV